MVKIKRSASKITIAVDIEAFYVMREALSKAARDVSNPDRLDFVKVFCDFTMANGKDLLRTGPAVKRCSECGATHDVGYDRCPSCGC